MTGRRSDGLCEGDVASCLVPAHGPALVLGSGPGSPGFISNLHHTSLVLRPHRSPRSIFLLLHSSWRKHWFIHLCVSAVGSRTSSSKVPDRRWITPSSTILNKWICPVPVPGQRENCGNADSSTWANWTPCFQCVSAACLCFSPEDEKKLKLTRQCRHRIGCFSQAKRALC